MRRLSYSSVFLAVALAACASGSGGGGSSSGSSDLITAEELAGVAADNAYDAVRTLRPRWMRARGGGTPATVLDGRRQTDNLDGLRTIPVTSIVSIRYMSPSDATTAYGTGFTNGLIEVRTR